MCRLARKRELWGGQSDVDQTLQVGLLRYRLEQAETTSRTLLFRAAPPTGGQRSSHSNVVALFTACSHEERKQPHTNCLFIIGQQK